MTRAGAMYLQARQGAADCRLVAGIAAAHGFQRQLQPALDAAASNDRRADQIRAQFYRGRKAAARVPANYFADAPRSSEERGAGSE